MTPGNQDREFRRSEYLYPNPRDSRVVEPNPDYHPPIYFIGGAFWLDAAATKPLDVEQVPEYVLATVQDETLAAAKQHPHMTLTASEPFKPADAAKLLEEVAEANEAEVAPTRRRAQRLRPEERVGHQE